MLILSPKSFYKSDFLTEGEANTFFDFFNNIDGQNKNLFNNYKPNRETIVFASDEIVDNPGTFTIPPIWEIK